MAILIMSAALPCRAGFAAAGSAAGQLVREYRNRGALDTTRIGATDQRDRSAAWLQTASQGNYAVAGVRGIGDHVDWRGTRLRRKLGDAADGNRCHRAARRPRTQPDRRT